MRWALKELPLLYLLCVVIALCERDHYRSDRDQGRATDLKRREVFAEEQPCSKNDEDDAELVDGGYAGGRSKLQSAEVT